MQSRLLIPYALSLALGAAVAGVLVGATYAQAPPSAAPSVLPEPAPVEIISPTEPATPPPAQPAPPITDVPVTTVPPAAKPDEKSAERTKGSTAKQLFGSVKLPTIGNAVALGYYPRGCLQGGVELAPNGPHWQVMRLSRNRNWGHPSLVRYVKNFAARAAKVTGWNGILVGDLAQPRGGPTPTSHTSHQTGLDVDIWFIPMPKETLTSEQREQMSANNLVADDWKRVNPAVYTPQHAAFIKAATEAPEVDRVLVNAAIKKKLCETATGDRRWLAKVRPWYGHHDHIHVRLICPSGQAGCKGMAAPPPPSEGCGDADLKFWFTKALEPVKPRTTPPKPMMLADLPPACKAVLAAPAPAK